MQGTLEQVRTALRARLQARLTEIEEGTLTRIQAISSPSEISDPEYAMGLRVAVTVALNYALAAIEHGEDQAPSIPSELMVQTRMAARNGVSLDTVLRRYFAGYTLLGDFLMQELEEGWQAGSPDLKRLVRVLATIFDRLIVTIIEEYGREVQGQLNTSEQRRAERVKRLLAGELMDTSELQYDFNTQHLGGVACGPGAVEGLQALAKALDCRLLLVRPDEETAWAWFGRRRRLDFDKLEHAVAQGALGEASLAIGERSEGLAGWRLTHRQAKAALPIALRRSQRLVRYGDVALVASIVQDDLLSTSLRALYLAPLERDRDGGETARRTLRAYFNAERHVSSAAASLGVNRNTVASRLCAIEDALGRSLGSCAAELEFALRLEDLDPTPST